MEESLVFRYTAKASWGRLICRISVMDRGSGGTVSGVFYGGPLEEKPRNEWLETVELPICSRDLCLIRRYIREGGEAVTCGQVEFPHILDGFVNSLDFCVQRDGRSVISRVEAHNLWAFRKEKGMAARSLRLCKGVAVAGLFDRVARVLLRSGVPEKYLALRHSCGKECADG